MEHEPVDHQFSDCCPSSQKDLAAGEDIARCPSCSLYVQVIYDQVQEEVLCCVHRQPLHCTILNRLCARLKGGTVP